MAAIAVASAALAAADAPRPWMMFAVLGAIAMSFAAERLAPYDRSWNASMGDRTRDVIHAAVNESTLLVTLALFPTLSEHLTAAALWPSSWPFAAELLLAVLAADLGITLAHRASHKVGWLWRLHAVHHSVQRFYGFNGLMKHPLHQTIELLAGVAPLLLVGLPVQVAVALAACVAIQLLLQHSNVAYAVFGLDRWLAWNRPHRFHHLASASDGDVNFGLFTTLWDRALSTYHEEPQRRFSIGDLGVAGRPDYPTNYLDQLREPFRSATTSVR